MSLKRSIWLLLGILSISAPVFWWNGSNTPIWIALPMILFTVGAFTNFLYALLDQGRDTPRTLSDGSKLSRLGWGARIVIFAGGVLCFVSATALFLVWYAELTLLRASASFSIGICGGYLFLVGLRAHVRWDDETIAAVGFGGLRQHKRAWSNLADIMTVSGPYTASLMFRDGHEMPISDFCEGQKHILIAARRKKAEYARTAGS